MLISYYYAGNFNVRCGNAVSGNAAVSGNVVVSWEGIKTGGRACQRRDTLWLFQLDFIASPGEQRHLTVTHLIPDSTRTAENTQV